MSLLSIIVLLLSLILLCITTNMFLMIYILIYIHEIKRHIKNKTDE